jgi:uncharacterized protein (DUF305 family)
MRIHSFSSFRIALLLLGSGLVALGLYAQSHGHGNRPGDADDYWSKLNASMDKMHMAMAGIEQSGDADTDFVRLMLPHHQGAIEMAKVQLMHGKDPQMRRLAQEIITDQQSEIELMQQWLKAHGSAPSKENDESAAGRKKEK